MTQNGPGDHNDTNDTNVLNDTNDTNVLNDTNDTNVVNDTKCYGAAESRERGTLSLPPQESAQHAKILTACNINDTKDARHAGSLCGNAWQSTLQKCDTRPQD